MSGHAWPFQRGYAAVGLHHPKTGWNVGGAMRAANCYGAKLVAMTGTRCADLSHQSDVMKLPKHLPVLRVEDLRLALPHDCVPVAVDLVEDAVSLSAYQHPPRAMYIFGPEDGTLGEKVLSWCHDRVMVPTRGCMNLAATVNVVLYDRVAKAERHSRASRRAVLPGRLIGRTADFGSANAGSIPTPAANPPAPCGRSPEGAETLGSVHEHAVAEGEAP